MSALVGLVEVKEHLDKVTSTDDAELITFINSVTPVVEDYVGDIDIKTYNERHAACYEPYLRLRHGPVLSVTSIKDWLDDSLLYATGALKLDTETGTVYLKDGGYFTGIRPYLVIYEAGRSTIGENLRMAASMIVAHNWKTQRGALIRFPGSDEASLPPGFTYSVPRKALEYLRSERRNKVVVA